MNEFLSRERLKKAPAKLDGWRASTRSHPDFLAIERQPKNEARRAKKTEPHIMYGPFPCVFERALATSCASRAANAGVEFPTQFAEIEASRASYYSMLTYAVPVDRVNEDGCRVYLSSMLWPGWLLLSAPKRRIGFQRLHVLSRTPVHRRWRALVLSSAFAAAAMAVAATKRSISNCRSLADGWRLSTVGWPVRALLYSASAGGVRLDSHGCGGQLRPPLHFRSL